MTAIFYHPDAYSTTTPKLMGRNVAGDSFLRGFLQHASPASSLFAQVASEVHGREFKKLFNQSGRSENLRIFSNQNLNSAIDAQLVYHPDPEIGVHAYRRSLYANNSWSLCGITHTTSSAAAMDAISEWITAPVQPWDAVICTSTAVKNNVETILQAQVDLLEMRLGIQKVCLPQLPVIPLGVHTDDFHYSEAARASSRQQLGVNDDTLVVLYVGRLSFHGKAHPLAMYQALENAAKATGHKAITLIECGWHANEQIGIAFTQGANSVSPSVSVIHLDGRIEGNRKVAWSSADIFCSLSDNIQETFGIVPIEAMSAGLPLVVSDWDGYKDTVRDGTDGFRIPTLTPPPGLAGDLAHRHALQIDTYDMYIGHTSALVAIDANKLTRSFIELFKSPELRRRMGEAGRLNAIQNYDWRHIIRRYEELWDEQSNIRTADRNLLEGKNTQSKRNMRPIWPARLDPTIAFANYGTLHLAPNTKLTLSEQTAGHALEKLAEYKGLAMVNFAEYMFPTDAEIKSVFEIAERNLPQSSSAEDLLHGASELRRPFVFRGLVWLCKLGLLQLA